MNARVGLFGGTFDPIHWGHVRAAWAACNGANLTNVILIPSARPPHKNFDTGTDGAHRLAMCRLAARDNERLDVSDVEIERGGESYTLLTLQHFLGAMPGARIVFLLGADAYEDIATWYRVAEALPLVDWVVLRRPGMPTPDLARPLREHAALFEPADGALRLRAGATSIRYLEIPETPVSSTQVRRAIREGLTIDELVPPAVADYIARHGLYR
ncbi:MAG: nicotinate (nicotinamide) nucleotide adenylyltransferase [Deltaproteobacteria bacterium]|nr:nicotinate (nicotinamide) nucleotide adenylyltransferase [Deltaproteobacteria bacterium]